MSRSADQAQLFIAQLEPIKDALERYALRSAWNKGQAADILQQAVMTGWREYHRFQQGTDFKAWMFRILVNTIYSFNKKNRRDQRQQLTTPIEELDVTLEREQAWSSVLENPEAVFNSLDERIVGAIGALSIDERQCLLLRIIEGYSYKEISAMLEMAMGTVMSHVHRARMKLRERLADLALEMNMSGDVSNELQRG